MLSKSEFINFVVNRYDGSASFVAPSSSKLIEWGEFFRRLIGVIDTDAATIRTLCSEAPSLGVELFGYGDFWVVAEPGGVNTGLGIYIFRIDGDGTILGLPHRGNDTHTQEIGIRMFYESSASIFWTNTVDRDEVDLSRALNHPIIQLCKAVSNKEWRWVEIHGYGSALAGTDGVQPDLIIANGTGVSGSSIPPASLGTPYWHNLHAQLQDLWDAYAGTGTYKIRQFGVLPYHHEYAASTNENGKLLNSATVKCEFLHLEHKIDLRSALLNDESLRREYYAVISN